MCSTRNVELVRSLGADHVIDQHLPALTRARRRVSVSAFEVHTADLPAAAVRIAATGRELASVQSAMAGVQGAAGAADAPQVAAALSALAQALSATAGSIGVATEALAATTQASAGAYEATDLTGMPNIGGLPAPGD